MTEKARRAACNFRVANHSRRADVREVFMSIPSLPFFRATQVLLATLALVVSATAESILPPTIVPLDNLAAFKSPASNWQTAGGVGGNPRVDKTLVAAPGNGILVNNPTKDAHSQLVTKSEYGDAEVDLDFLMTSGSNSGVYLMGRYELQLFDSWKAKTPTFADCGGIYQRWDDARGEGKQGYEGHAPIANASRAPGLWQHLHIEFRAPRFDPSGKKIADARFTKVVLNDFTVQENIEVTGPTRSALFTDESKSGPLMIQGDHGPVAIRSLAIKAFDPTATTVQVDNLNYKLYPIDPEKNEKYDSAPPKSQGKPSAFSTEVIEKDGKFAIVFTGVFVIPRDGAYAFITRSFESVALTIDDQPAIIPFDGGGQSEARTLTAGRHAFHLEYIHRSSWGRPNFNLSVEGPSLAPFLLTAAPEKKTKSWGEDKRTLIVEPPSDRVLALRSFVPYEPKKRLYAISVGTPAGRHYAYDFETGAILRVWRGKFLDTHEMWDDRGENQIGKPAGPALTLNSKPVLALLERYTHDWPDQPDAMWSSQGYRLEPNGQPTFLFKLSSLSATDRIAPIADGSGLTRTLTVSGETTSWSSWVLLAEAGQITPQADGHSYVIGDRSYYLDLPADSAIQPILRTRNGRQQLVVPIGRETLGKPITYSLVW